MRQSVHQALDEKALQEALRRSPNVVGISYAFRARSTSSTVDRESGGRSGSPTLASFRAIRSVGQVETSAQRGGGTSVEGITIWCFDIPGQAFSTRDYFTTDDDSNRWNVISATISPGKKTWVLIGEREG